MQVPGTIALSELDRVRLDTASDEALRKRFVADPTAVLKERGIDIPDGVNVSVVEDSLENHTITLPPFVGSDLSRDSLRAQAGEASTWECTTCTPTSPICAGSLASLTCA